MEEGARGREQEAWCVCVWRPGVWVGCGWEWGYVGAGGVRRGGEGWGLMW